MTKDKTNKIWKLNASNRETKNGLTRSVQEVIEVNDENRMQLLTEHLGEVTLEFLIQEFGEPTRVTGIAMIDGRAVPLGDCECMGEHCRANWGWVWKTKDLDMVGHRGSLWAEPCKSFKATIYDANTGEFAYAAPWGMAQEQFYRFQRKEWGDVDKLGLQNFMSANLATAENRQNSWKVD